MLHKGLPRMPIVTWIAMVMSQRAGGRHSRICLLPFCRCRDRTPLILDLGSLGCYLYSDDTIDQKKVFLEQSAEFPSYKDDSAQSNIHSKIMKLYRRAN
ncbi:hypothetical protein DFS33DRAFT_1310010 [Desarmillaria ectypa]|nr:hypothetical protein DFS33DRAFT_1310010 [Desarmillaria ectypa]